jgi:hypothetical protein
MMNTIMIGTHAMPITPALEHKFLEFYAYYSLPTQVKCRIDPKCKQYQALYDDLRSALSDACVEYFESQDLTDHQMDELEDLVYQQDICELTDQLEQALALESQQ